MSDDILDELAKLLMLLPENVQSVFYAGLIQKGLILNVQDTEQGQKIVINAQTKLPEFIDFVTDFLRQYDR
jgi:hypothetical protein